jgi:hypothetical protein
VAYQQILGRNKKRHEGQRAENQRVSQAAFTARAFGKESSEQRKSRRRYNLNTCPGGLQ